MVYKRKDKVRNECPICYDFVYCLRLDCNHSFCKSCIKGTILHYNTDMNEYFMCPLGRCDIRNIKDNKLNKLLQHLYKKIELRKMGYNLLIYDECILCIYYFPIEKDKYNYPIKRRFKTFESEL